LEPNEMMFSIINKFDVQHVLKDGAFQSNLVLEDQKKR